MCKVIGMLILSVILGAIIGYIVSEILYRLHCGAKMDEEAVGK